MEDLAWQLPFNAKNANFGHHNPRKTYSLNNQNLESITSEKDLRGMLDDKLRFHIHAVSATKKANQILGVKKDVIRDVKTISTLYKSMVRPHLEY